MSEISVAMAAYNGEKFINEQIVSILSQLNKDDEVVVSLNESTDTTLEILKCMSKEDSRIKIYMCEEKGVISNFENAISKCKNDIIFLSDQDDVWLPGKKDRILKILERNIDGVVHSHTLVNSHLVIVNDMKKGASYFIHPWNIIYRNQVQGSCMAFKKRCLDYILPIPPNVPMHDSWIGFLISSFGRLYYLDESYLLYRQHDNNVTSRKHRSFYYMLTDRILLLFLGLKRIIKYNASGIMKR